MFLVKDKLPSEAPLAITAMTESSKTSLVPRFTKPDANQEGASERLNTSDESVVSEEFYTGNDEDDIPDLCYGNYDTIQVIRGKIYVFEEEVSYINIHF